LKATAGGFVESGGGGSGLKFAPRDWEGEGDTQARNATHATRLNDDEEEGEETQRRRHYEGDVTEGVGDSSLECDADLSERMGRNPAQAKYSISHQSGPKAAVSKLSKASSWHISVVNSLYGIDRRFGKHAISLGSSATAQK